MGDKEDVQLSDAVAAVADNKGVEYVISFKFQGEKKETAEAEFQKLIAALDGVGLRTEVRDGANGNALVFVRVRSEQKLIGAVYRARVKDWLHGVRAMAPDKETQRSLDKEPLTEAERLRIVWQLITLPKSEGGAGLTPKQGEWKLVESIFPLHDHEFNKAWMKNWSSTWTVGPEELGKLRDRFGEKVAFYFAFLQTYLSFLTVAAVIGATSYFLLPSYSLTFAITNCLWSVIFVEYWKRQEVDLAVRWGVRNVSSLQNRRAQFQHEKEVEDPVTGEVVKFFPASKRLARQALYIPFALGASALLSALYASVFAIEIYLSEVYNGPFKSVLVFLPTALLSTLVPVLTNILTKIATMLTEFENYENESSYTAAMTQKIFIFNFICSYVPLFLTAFIYVPFGNYIVPHLNFFITSQQHFPLAALNTTTANLTSSFEPLAHPSSAPFTFQVNPSRLKKQVIYFTVTAQVVSLALETLVPFLKRKLFRTAKKFQHHASHAKPIDPPAEAAFLKRVRNEAELDTYDVHTDLREMTMQFGYLTLFSPVWPLAAVSFAINNWIELRSDAVKICVEMKRPVPHRADSIGPWLHNLGFLAWMGSISSAALIYLFSGVSDGEAPTGLTGWGVLTAVLFSEHVYFATAYLVHLAFGKLESPGLLHERRERFLVRRAWMAESLDVDEEEEMGVKKEARGGEEEGGFWAARRVGAVVEEGKTIIGRGYEKKDQ